MDFTVEGDFTVDIHGFLLVGVIPVFVAFCGFFWHRMKTVLATSSYVTIAESFFTRN